MGNRSRFECVYRDSKVSVLRAGAILPEEAVEMVKFYGREKADYVVEPRGTYVYVYADEMPVAEVKGKVVA